MTFYPIKLIVGIVAGFVATAIGNLLPLFLAVIVFEVVDFVTGCIKSAVVARRKKERFAFESTFDNITKRKRIKKQTNYDTGRIS